MSIQIITAASVEILPNKVVAFTTIASIFPKLGNLITSFARFRRRKRNLDIDIVLITVRQCDHKFHIRFKMNFFLIYDKNRTVYAKFI